GSTKSSRYWNRNPCIPWERERQARKTGCRLPSPAPWATWTKNGGSQHWAGLRCPRRPVLSLTAAKSPCRYRMRGSAKLVSWAASANQAGDRRMKRRGKQGGVVLAALAILALGSLSEGLAQVAQPTSSCPKDAAGAADTLVLPALTVGARPLPIN